jgi:tetratricopeptide (TPR) repeat protein
MSGALTLFVVAAGACLAASGREPQLQPTQVAVHAGQAGCQVEVDAQTVGKTDTAGNLTVKEVEPGDHYLHVHCPGREESAYFISLRAGENLALEATSGAASQQLARPSLGVAETRAQLQQLVLEAVQLRAKGRLEEAVEKIRRALKLDPENADLHRELGITFLLSKDWKRARIEMIEAIRHDPTDADAHNGLGYALEKLGDLDAALKEYRVATRLEPDDPTYRTHYFDALSKIAQQKAKK